jgi:periplasmic divalent cation tolerance protein
MNSIFIYIVSKNKREAERIARHLLLKKLAGCANIFPIESLFWWKGKIVKEKEVVLIVKTSKSNFERIKKEVLKLHSYQIPCIAKIPVNLNEEYHNWLRGLTR